MKSFFSKTKMWILAHKVASVVIVIIIALATYGVVRAFSNTTAETRYVVANIAKGNIISSISGTGQVSASNQVDLDSKTSGAVLYLNATVGQEVATDTLIAQTDPGDAAYELETAKLSYDKLTTVDPDDLRDKQNTLTEAEDDLANEYTTARTTLTSTSTDMSDTLSGVQDLFDNYLNETKKNGVLGTVSKGYIDKAQTSYYAADKLVEAFVKKYRTVTTLTSETDVESLVSEASDASVAVAQTAKDAQDAVVYLRNQEDKPSSDSDQAYTSVTGLVSKSNSIVSSLSSLTNSIGNDKRSVNDAQIALDELNAGPDDLDLRSEALSVKQKQDAYDDSFIRAPFAGVIAAVDVKKGDTVNSGTAIATLITKQKVAEISLNEIDAAKVTVGQKATLTFDAIPDLTISGSVIEVDLVGKVTQGVVNYTIKIGFDTDDAAVKPGMTVSADIITDMKQDVLIAPSSAVKAQNGMSYVQVFDPPLTASGAQGTVSITPPTQIEVTTGISDDTNVEILSGLTEGQQIVTRTITGTTTAAAATNSAATRATGGGARLGGGAVRAF